MMKDRDQYGYPSPPGSDDNATGTGDPEAPGDTSTGDPLPPDDDSAKSERGKPDDSGGDEGARGW